MTRKAPTPEQIAKLAELERARYIANKHLRDQADWVLYLVWASCIAADLESVELKTEDGETHMIPRAALEHEIGWRLLRKYGPELAGKDTKPE